MPLFKVGSRVFLTDSAESVGIGTIVNVIPCDSGLCDFTLYEVDFVTGLRTLHGFNLRPVLTRVFSCDEKQRLWIAHQNALDIYLRVVKELAEAVGMMAHAEFEFLERNVEAAKKLSAQARDQLYKHTDEHGC